MEKIPVWGEGEPFFNELFFREGIILKIGRAGSCNLIINSNYVSGNHAQIEATAYYKATKKPTQYSITDLNSTNGTYVNRVKIEGGRAVRLKHGDIIAIGLILLEFKLQQLEYGEPPKYYLFEVNDHQSTIRRRFK